MLTNVIDLSSATRLRATDDPSAGRKIVIVNGGAEVQRILESVIETGHYDVVFVESSAHAYSQIRKVLPDLVILCLHLEDPEAFRVLSMLKLDPATRDVPLLTWAASPEPNEAEPEDWTDDPAFASGPELRMN